MTVKDLKVLLESLPEEWDDMRVMGEVTEWGDKENGEPIYSIKPYNIEGEYRLLLRTGWDCEDYTDKEVKEIVDSYKVKSLFE